MKRSPSFQHYPDRLTQPIKHLSWRARGFFRELQDFMWTESPDYCSIPNDPAAWILAVPGATLEEAEAMMAEIQNPHKQLLKVEGDRLVCNGLRKIRARQVEVSQKRSAAGKLGKRAQLSGKTENLPEQPSGKALANANPELAFAKKRLWQNGSFALWSRRWSRRQKWRWSRRWITPARRSFSGDVFKAGNNQPILERQRYFRRSPAANIR